MHRSLRPFFFVFALVAIGCSEADFDGGFADDEPPDFGNNPGFGGMPADGADLGSPFDASLDSGSPCPVELAVFGCLETLRDVCDYRDSLGDCIDLDDDCFVDACPGVDEERVQPILDCADDNPDIHPFATEVCDDVDNDCDDLKEEGFEDKGLNCEACGQAGTIICDVDDPTQTRCRPNEDAAGMPIEMRPEYCNELDDDCDGVIDERCVIRGQPDQVRYSPRVCGDALLYVEGNDILSTRRGGPTVIIHSGGEPPAIETRPIHLACDADWLVWLEMADGEDCVVEDRGNKKCLSEIWVADLARAGVPREIDTVRQIEAERSFGPPIIGGGLVYYTEHISGGQSVIRYQSPTHMGVPSTISDPNASLLDPVLLPPTAQGNARILARRFSGENWSVVTRLPGLAPESVIQDSSSVLGPPTASNEWIAWSAGEETPSLWAVPTENLRVGFQPVDRAGPQLNPKLSGDILVWLDAGTAPPTLRWMHLVTGLSRTIAQAHILPGDFDVTNDVVVWIEQTEEGPLVRLDGEQPGPPPVEPTPDATLPDGGPSDASVGSPDALDGPIDAGLSDAGILPVDGALHGDGGGQEPADAGTLDAR